MYLKFWKRGKTNNSANEITVERTTMQSHDRVYIKANRSVEDLVELAKRTCDRKSEVKE